MEEIVLGGVVRWKSYGRVRGRRSRRGGCVRFIAEPWRADL